tara:strand:- start:67 stop:276 length:210 start_codon:yes stop_codon:yes gene_type:complete
MIYNNNNNLNKELNANKNDDFYNFTSNNIIYKKNINNEIDNKNFDLIKNIGIIDTSNLEKSISKAMKNS